MTKDPFDDGTWLAQIANLRSLYNPVILEERNHGPGGPPKGMKNDADDH